MHKLHIALHAKAQAHTHTNTHAVLLCTLIRMYINTCINIRAGGLAKNHVTQRSWSWASSSTAIDHLMHTSPLLTIDFLRKCWRLARQLFSDTLPCRVYAASVSFQCKMIVRKAFKCWHASSSSLSKPPIPPSTPMSCHAWYLDGHPHVLRSILTLKLYAMRCYAKLQRTCEYTNISNAQPIQINGRLDGQTNPWTT